MPVPLASVLPRLNNPLLNLPPSVAQQPPSRLTLGTVQFGLDYGIANRTGRPTYDAVREIISVAFEGGVNVLDTAPGYGDSETCLGQALDDLGLKEKVRVVTKLAPLADDLLPTQAAEKIEEGVVLSLKRLRLSHLPVCLFHKETNLKYAAELLALRDRGLVQMAGVSFVSPRFAEEALKFPELKAWQIPANILDRRFTDVVRSKAAAANDVFIFARSIYLQGLLLLDEAQIPSYLSPVVGALRHLRTIAEAFRMPFQELAFRAMLSRPHVHSLVVGVETVSQMTHNLEVLAKGPLPAEVFSAVESFVPDLPGFIVSPPEWEAAQKKAAVSVAEAPHRNSRMRGP